MIIVSDVDGVLNTGQFLYNDKGKTYKVFGAHDSDGIKLLKQAGYTVEFISADRRGFSITQKRLTDMKCDLTLVSEHNRFDWVNDKYGIENVIFVGDGLHDTKLLNKSKYGIAPNNACRFAKESADYITESNSGNGVFLDIAIKLLQLTAKDFNE